MPRHYFGGAPNAWAGGALFQQERRMRDVRENALNALIQRFGPEAGDPGAFSQLEAVDQRRQLLPHQIRGFERQDELHPYEIAAREHLEKVRPLQLSAMQRDDDAFGALTQERGPIAGSPAAHGIHRQEQELLRSAAANAARGIQHAIRNDGDVLAAFDRAMRVLPHLGLPAEELARMRDVIEENPEAAGELVQMLLGAEGAAGAGRMLGQGQAFTDPEGNTRFFQFGPTGEPHEPLPGFVPTAVEQAEERLGQGRDRINQRDRALTNEEARMRGFNATPGHQFYETPEGEIYARVIGGTSQERDAERQEREAAREAAEQVDLLSNQDFSLRTSLAQNRTALRDAERALAQLTPRVQRTPAGVRGVAQFLPFDSNTIYQVRRSLDTLKKNIGIDTLLGIRRGGATLGQVPQQQLEFLSETRGDLRVTRRPDLLIEDLEKIVSEYRSLIQWQEEAAERVGGELQRIRGSQQGGAPPQEEPQAGGGWQQRAQELQAQGLSQQEILDTLRREGLIR